MSAKEHRLDPYVVETLMRDLVAHDHRPSAFLVYLCVAAASEGRATAFSHGELAERTGLSKRAVQDAVAHLTRRGLLTVEARGPTEARTLTALTPWRR